MVERPSFDQAVSIVCGAISALGSELIPVRLAAGRRLAAPAFAAIDLPRFTNAAMDGYAVRSADCQLASECHPLTLLVTDQTNAGDPTSQLAPGSAQSVSTGAPIPVGADTVVVREAVVSDHKRITLVTAPTWGANVRQVGEDAKTGAQLLSAGEQLGPDAIAALSGFGVSEVEVRRLPTIAFFSTGNELTNDLVELDGSCRIIDSNGPMIAAFAKSVGVQAHALSASADTHDALDAVFDRLEETAADLVISTGAASVGTRDLLRSCLERRGGTVYFHGIRMRPGKPLLFATLADGRPFFGLPGNPVAALIGLRFIVSAALRRMLGLRLETGRAVSGDQEPRPGTTVFLRGKRHQVGDIETVDTAFDQRSHVLSSVLSADTWLRIDADTSGAVVRQAYPKWAANIHD